MKIFKNDMEMIIQTIDTEKLPGYKRLLTEEYWKISDDRFPYVIEEVLSNVKNGDLKLIEIVKLFAYFSYFSRRKLIPYDMQTIKDLFIKGMDVVVENSEYCSNIEEELSRIGIDVGEDMTDVLKHFYELNRKLKIKMYKDKAEDIFKCIPMRMEVFYDKFTTECAKTPTLNYYDVNKMMQRITCASNEDIMKIKEMLLLRAKKNTRELEAEIPFITELKETLDAYCTGKEVNIKTVTLREFSSDLENILNLYKDLPRRRIYTRKKKIDFDSI